MFWITIKVSNQVSKEVMDPGTLLPIVVRRMLKQAEIQKTETVAIRVGDGRTLHSWGGVTVCLADEKVTQPCKRLDIDVFDLVTGAVFLLRNPELRLLSLQIPFALHCYFGSGLFPVPLSCQKRKNPVDDT